MKPCIDRYDDRVKRRAHILLHGQVAHPSRVNCIFVPAYIDGAKNPSVRLHVFQTIRLSFYE